MRKILLINKKQCKLLLMISSNKLIRPKKKLTMLKVHLLKLLLLKRRLKNKRLKWMQLMLLPLNFKLWKLNGITCTQELTTCGLKSMQWNKEIQNNLMMRHTNNLPPVKILFKLQSMTSLMNSTESRIH
jgi:hypothetical protein